MDDEDKQYPHIVVCRRCRCMFDMMMTDLEFKENYFEDAMCPECLSEDSDSRTDDNFW